MTDVKSKILNRYILLLLVIFILALWLSVWAIDFGLPYVGYHTDEPWVTDRALHLLRQDELDLSLWSIGKAHVYLQVFISKLVFAAYEVNPTDIPTYDEFRADKGINIDAVGVPYPFPEYYLWGRGVVAFLGACSVVVLYFIGKEIKSEIVGLISAFFLAANSLYIEQSHFITRTSPGLFFLLLTFYIILRAYLQHKWLLYLLSLFLLYVAVHFKQNNLILLVPFTLALIMSLWHEYQHHSRQELVKYGVVTLSVFVLIFLLVWIFYQFNIFIFSQSIYNRIFNNSYVVGGTHFGYSGQNTFQWVVEQLLTGPRATWRIVVMLAIPGILLAIQLRQKGWLLLSIPIVYLLMFSFFTVRFTHWLVPILPFLAVLAALTLDWLYAKISYRRIFKKQMLVILFCLIVTLIPGASIRAAITLNYYASQPDVRQTAEAWMKANLPPDSKIVIDLWGPYLDPEQYNVVYVGSIGEESLQVYRDKNVDYLVLNSFNLTRIISAGLDPRTEEEANLQKERLQQIMDESSLEQEIIGPALFTPPVVSVLIYKVQ